MAYVGMVYKPCPDRPWPDERPQPMQARWPRRAGLSEAADELIGYLERHAHRMEYPEYLAHGWCIGSGAVESACKTVAGQRLKLAGMRWGEDEAPTVCHLRALYRSEKGQWEAFWGRDFSPD